MNVMLGILQFIALIIFLVILWAYIDCGFKIIENQSKEDGKTDEERG